jgi:hypothetical protein
MQRWPAQERKISDDFGQRRAAELWMEHGNREEPIAKSLTPGSAAQNLGKKLGQAITPEAEGGLIHRVWEALKEADAFAPFTERSMQKDAPESLPSFLTPGRDVSQELIKEPEREMKTFHTGELEYYQQQHEMGRHLDEILKDTETLEEHYPQMIAGGVAVSTAYITTKAGQSVATVIARSLISGTTAAITDIPIQAAVEHVAEDHPWLSIPFAIGLGLMVGMGAELPFENAVIRAAHKIQRSARWKGLGLEDQATVVAKALQALKDDPTIPITRLMDDVMPESSELSSVRAGRIPSVETGGDFGEVVGHEVRNRTMVLGGVSSRFQGTRMLLQSPHWSRC